MQLGAGRYACWISSIYAPRKQIDENNDAHSVAKNTFNEISICAFLKLVVICSEDLW